LSSSLSECCFKWFPSTSLPCHNRTAARGRHFGRQAKRGGSSAHFTFAAAAPGISAIPSVTHILCCPYRRRGIGQAAGRNKYLCGIILPTNNGNALRARHLPPGGCSATSASRAAGRAPSMTALSSRPDAALAARTLRISPLASVAHLSRRFTHLPPSISLWLPGREVLSRLLVPLYSPPVSRLGKQLHYGAMSNSTCSLLPAPNWRLLRVWHVPGHMNTPQSF